MTAPIQDLRDAIALLQQHDNQYLETNHPVDPNAELAGVYRHIGAGGTVKRPTRIGPAMMFNNIKGYPHSRILVGMHASRQRAALLLGCEASQLALEVGKAVKTPVAPVVVPAGSAPCQEQVFLADDPDFDLRTLLPAPTNTPIDAGPFFCLGWRWPAILTTPRSPTSPSTACACRAGMSCRCFLPPAAISKCFARKPRLPANRCR